MTFRNKTVYAGLLALAMLQLCIPAHSATPTATKKSPAPSPATAAPAANPSTLPAPAPGDGITLTQVQQLQMDSAWKDLALANAQIQIANDAQVKAKYALQQQVSDIKKENSWGDDVQFDAQHGFYRVPKTAPATTPVTSANPAAPVTAPAPTTTSTK